MPLNLTFCKLIFSYINCIFHCRFYRKIMCIFILNIKGKKSLSRHCSKFLVHALVILNIYSILTLSFIFKKEKDKNSPVDLLLIEITAYHSVVFSISFSFSPGNLHLKVALFWRAGAASDCGLCLPAQLHCVAVSWSSATTWSVPHRRTAELSLVLTQIYCKCAHATKMGPHLFLVDFFLNVQHFACLYISVFLLDGIL